MNYYKIVFKNGYSTIIESSEIVDLKDITNDEPFVIGNNYVNNASDVLIIEHLIEQINPFSKVKKTVVEDCEHCRYQGLTYCIDCFNNDLFSSKD